MDWAEKQDRQQKHKDHKLNKALQEARHKKGRLLKKNAAKETALNQAQRKDEEGGKKVADAEANIKQYDKATEPEKMKADDLHNRQQELLQQLAKLEK